MKWFDLIRVRVTKITVGLIAIMKKYFICVYQSYIGTLWIDNYGEMMIRNHKTGDYCKLDFKQYSYFGSGEVGAVSGVVYNKHNVPLYEVNGNWNDFVSVKCVNIAHIRTGDSIGTILQMKKIGP